MEIAEKRKQEFLEESIDKIGDITIPEYLAVKEYIGEKIIQAEIDLKNVQIKKSGDYYQCSPEDIVQGDTIKLALSLPNGKSGCFEIENIIDAQFDPRTGHLMVDSDKYTISNVPHEKELQKVSLAVKNPNCWITEQNLKNEFRNITYQEIQDVKLSKEIKKQEQRDLTESEIILDIENYDYEFNSQDYTSPQNYANSAYRPAKIADDILSRDEI